MVAELFPFLFIVLIYLFASFIKKLVKQDGQGKTAQQTRSKASVSGAQTAQNSAGQQNGKPFAKPFAAMPQSAFEPSEPFTQPFEDDMEGFDSQQEFHEGEDPCHDDLPGISETVPAQETASVQDETARRLLEGVVFSEILGRRRRRT